MANMQQNQPSSALDLPDDLLDAMKDLKDQGFQGELQIPQIVVCGDQSAGKSSVLEAISRFAFPSKGTFCTRFVTEVNLRTGSASRCLAEIRPADGRSEEQRRRLLAFRDRHVITGPHDLAKVIEAADKELRDLDRNVSIYADQLVIHIEGPDQKPLSVIDLPGLISTAAEGQAKKDIDTVRDIVNKYMSKPESIILAVVAANNDLSNQGVVQMARDNNGRARTLGIITKPDRLEKDPDALEVWLELIQEHGGFPGEPDLGWHVLRNRDYANKDASFEERDKIEAEFFKKSRWSACHESTLGIAALQKKLRNVQMKEISLRLPGLIDKVDDLVHACQARKSTLGEPLKTDQERAALLADVNRQVHGHIEEAVQGRSSTMIPNHVRARIRRSLNNFANLMNNHGMSYALLKQEFFNEIHGDDGDGKPKDRQIQSSTMHLSAEEVLATFEKKRYKQFPIKIYEQTAGNAITSYIEQNPGCEAPGISSTDVWRILFRMQVAPWKQMVHDAMKHVYQEVRDFFELVVQGVGPQHIAENILEHVAEPAWAATYAKLEAKTNEIIQPYVSGDFFTLDAARIHEAVRQSRKQCVEEDAQRNPEIPAQEANRQYSAHHSWRVMEEHFNIARATVLENFANLAIEQCLVKDLRRILLDPDIPITDTELTNRIVEEPEELKEQRDKNDRQLEALLRITTVLNKHRRSRGMSQTRRSKGTAGKRTQSADRRNIPATTVTSEDAGAVRAKGGWLEVEQANHLGIQTPPKTPERAT